MDRNTLQKYAEKALTHAKVKEERTSKFWKFVNRHRTEIMRPFVTVGSIGLVGLLTFHDSWNLYPFIVGCIPGLGLGFGIYMIGKREKRVKVLTDYLEELSRLRAPINQNITEISKDVALALREALPKTKECKAFLSELDGCLDKVEETSAHKDWERLLQAKEDVRTISEIFEEMGERGPSVKANHQENFVRTYLNKEYGKQGETPQPLYTRKLHDSYEREIPMS